MKKAIWTLAIVMLSTLSCFAVPVCSLPQKLQVAIASHYPGWRLMQLSDLASDDQSLWKQAHPQECPGLIEGHFTSPVEHSTVFAIISIKLNKETILLARESNPVFLTVMAPEDGTSLVLHRLPAGKYSEYDNSKSLHTHWDSIAIEKIEAAERLRYWNGHSFQTIYLED
jgi:hypothetical protein